jgi:CheY-like chemotaxis protein
MPFRLMIVDDDSTVRKIVGKYAQELAPQVEILEAANGQECLDHCSEKLPDLIVLDINMPVMRGDECLRSLRAQQRTCSIPIVLVTTEAEKKLVLRLLSMGVQEYIIKPFDKTEFLTKVRGVLARKPKEGAAGDARPGATPAGPYVLIVEDRDTIIEAIRSAAPEDYPIIATSRPNEAMAHFRQHAPAAVFVSLALPQGDPFGMLAEMYAMPQRQGVRFVGMCLKTAGLLVGRARKMNHVRLLLKPFTADKVRAILPQPQECEVKAERRGDVTLLRCEGNKFWTLANKILAAIDNAAEDGFLKLVVDMSKLPAEDLQDPTLWIEISEHLTALGMTGSFIAPSAELTQKLGGFLETKALPIETTEESALQALAA